MIDASGLVVAPGLVDLSARLREPGYEYKATLESEMQAAMQGGVTSLVCPPDTDPVLDEPGLVEMLKHRARGLNQAHVHPLGALTMGLKGKALTEMAELTEAGCIGFAQAEEPIEDTTVLLRALQYAKTFEYTVWLRPQDAHIGRGGIAHSGPLASRLGLAGVPVMSETIALHTIFELVRATGARVHLCRISSAAGIELIRAAKKEGLPVTCDVGVHHIHMTDADIGFFDSNARVTPPFRSQRDRDAIRAGLYDGAIDAICSDHTPVDDDEKLLPFGEASPGATGLELLLSLTLKWADDYAAGQHRRGQPAVARARQGHLRGGARGGPGGRPAGARRGGRHRAVRSGRALEGRRRGAGQPGQAHAVRRLRAARAGDGHHRRRPRRLRTQRNAALNTTVAAPRGRLGSRGVPHDGKILLLRSAMTAPAVSFGAI